MRKKPIGGKNREPEKAKIAADRRLRVARERVA
jgi:hypothetical protein